MMPAQRIYLAAAALLALVIGASSGCNLVLGIRDLSPDGAGGGCATPCDDDDPCTVDACSSAQCTHTPQHQGPAPNSAQTAFDCKVVACVDGKAETQNDDLDTQDDAEDCTLDGCDAGTPTHLPKPDDSTCSAGGNGICKSGICRITCLDDAACDDQNPCTTDTCAPSEHVCANVMLNGVNTPGATQSDHDCSVQVCVDGVDTKSSDDSDLPATPTDCDEEICNDGVASNPPLAVDVACGPSKGMFCDGSGSCVVCNVATQCPGIDDDCQVRSCVNHFCGITYAPPGTPRASSWQKAGDCEVVVCDGAGASLAPNPSDDSDLPLDGNKCTKDFCTGGAVSHTFEPINTPCGNNSVCNAVGQCGCANDMACVFPDTCGGGNPGTNFICGCTKKSCAALGKTCGTVTDGCFSTQSCNDGSKQGTETDVDCGGGAAGTCGDTCAAGKQCNVDTDCGTGHCADGVCCNTACTGTCQACSVVKKGGGADGVCASIAIGLQDQNAAMTCVGAKVCDGANNCKKVDGQSCVASSECVNGHCADGVCCNSDCSGICQACTAAKKGSGIDGVCGNVPVNQQDPVATTPCIGTSACDGGVSCKSGVGQPCVNAGTCANGACVDLTCCGLSSCPACQSCALGVGGTCGNVPAGTPDNAVPNMCNGVNLCDGAGACKKVNGQACVLTSECATGTCVDGVCCGVASCPVCKSCALGVGGTCSNIPAGTPDNVMPNTCSGASTCDGSGTCKKANGQVCALTSECATGTCVDGVCCGVASCPVCMSCALGANGTCGVVPKNQPDSVSPNTCTITMACDGAGNCKLSQGQACSAHVQCAGGICISTCQ